MKSTKKGKLILFFVGLFIVLINSGSFSYGGEDDFPRVYSEEYIYHNYSGVTK